MRFLADNGLPVTVVPVSLYEDDDGRRLVDIERESEVTSAGAPDRGAGGRTQKTYMIDGRMIRIADLIEAGLISVGTEIELATRKKSARAVVTAEGTIKVGEHSYPTPSAAGKLVVGHSVDGWVTWRVPTKGNRTLADLRLELLERRVADDG